VREREGRRAVWAGSGAGPRLGKRKEEVRWADGGIGLMFFSFSFSNPFQIFSNLSFISFQI
jgi:hypothetical protein